jgi:hypothetical protein
VTAVVVIAALGTGAAAAFKVGPFADASPAVAAPRDLGPVIATVNGAPIYLSEMESRVQGIVSVHGDFEKTFGKDWKDKLLQNLVDDKIVEQAAADLGVTVSDAELQDHVDRLRQMFPDDAAFQAWLKQGQMDLAELTERVRLQTITSVLYLKVTDDVQISNDEAHAYWASHRDKYPGVDGQGAAFLAVKDQIKEDLAKKQRDAGWAAWLEDQRTKVDVQVVMPDWWKEIV